MVVAVAAVLGSGAAWGQIKPADLGGQEYTCMGAERAGTSDGMVPAFTGKWTTDYPGWKGPGVYSPGPYAHEKPLFVITAQNMGKYAQHLTPGQKLLFKKYPTAYRMPVYPSHRDFGIAKSVCKFNKENAGHAQLTEGGLAFTGATTGGLPFPIVGNGAEAIINVLESSRVWKETGQYDAFAVFSNGSVAKGGNRSWILAPAWNPNKHIPWQDTVTNYFHAFITAPPRNYGTITVGFVPTDFTKNQQAWGYSPGTRRVRQAPFFGFDTPFGVGGLRTVDDGRMFNGSPIRYTWKLLGKKEVFVPYDNFEINSPKIDYKELLNKSTPNPKYMRYEMHRVWVLEGVLKTKYRHIYKKRVLYIDEDSWMALMADNYDVRDNLWRVNALTTFYAPGVEALESGPTIYRDTLAGAYLIDRLMNHTPKFWNLSPDQKLTPQMFSPSAMQREGN